MSWLLVSDNFGGAGGAAQKDAGRLYAAVRFEPCGRRTTPQHRVDGTSIAGEVKKVLATVFANRRPHTSFSSTTVPLSRGGSRFGNCNDLTAAKASCHSPPRDWAPDCSGGTPNCADRGRRAYRGRPPIPFPLEYSRQRRLAHP